MLIYGISLSLTPAPPRPSARDGIRSAPRSVSLLLNDAGAPPVVKAPAQNLVDPEGAAGEGHREGTSTLDPRLAKVQTTLRFMPTEAVDPEELGPSPHADRVGLSLNPALPLATGGNGLARGTGKDAVRGAGEPAPDLTLVPIRQVPIYHTLASGEEATATRQLVLVRILIGEDGVPFQAAVISGPAILHEKALEAALQWRFEPPGAHGLKAPVPLTLIFHPIFKERP